MQYAIKQLFHINASRQKVFEALSTINGLTNWWTIQVEGSEAIGDAIQFNFGDFVGPKMETTQLKPAEMVSWKCISNDQGWQDHTFTFALDENDGKTRVRFSHDGWAEQNDSYAACCFSWSRYLESLRQYCQTGKGEAFGSDGYRK